MSETTTGAPDPPRVSSGCRGGCLLGLLIAVVIIGAIAWGAISTYGGAYQMTSPAARTFEPLPPDQSATVENQIQAAKQALTKGEPAEIHLSPEELNAWFFAGPKNYEFAERMRFGTEDDWLVANVSVPLTFMGQLPFAPSFHDRFFNGKLAVRLSADHGQLKVENFDLVGNGKRLPWLFTSQSYKQTVTQAVNKALKDRLAAEGSLADEIESIRVANNEIVVKFGKGEEVKGEK
jgi:hypothetical protein